MLVEIAIADAYGAGLEYVDPEEARKLNTVERYYPHPLHDLKPGSYTDDTQMTIANAEFVVDIHKGRLPDVNTAEFAQKFCEVFHRDPRKGYSSGFYTALQGVVSQPCGHRVRWGVELINTVGAHGRSTKNGAAMRACPFAVIPDLQKAMGYSMIQAMVTHRGSAIEAAVGTTAAAWYCYHHEGPMDGLVEWLQDRFTHEGTVALMREPWPEDRPVLNEPTRTLGLDTFRAALWAVLRSESLSEVLRRSVAYTGDVDTVAAIAMGIASHRLENDLPQHLYGGLENGEFGRDFLEDLDRELRMVVRERIECPNCGGEGGFDGMGEDVCELCEGKGTVPEGWNED